MSTPVDPTTADVLQFLREFCDRYLNAKAQEIAAYRERTQFFRDSTPAILKIQEQGDAARAFGERMEDALAEMGIGKPRVRVKKNGESPG